MNNFDDWSQIISKYLKSESDPLGSLSKHELEGDAARIAFIRAVLDRFLPEIYGVGSGQIMDSKGKMSGKMDIIVYRRDFPRLDLPGSRDIYLYESVIATVEVAAKLVKKTFFDALNQIASLADLTPDIDKKVMVSLAAKNQLTLNRDNEYVHSDPLLTGRFNLISRPLSFIYAFNGYKTSANQLAETIEAWMQERSDQDKPVDMKTLPAVIATQGCFAWRNSAPMTLSENCLMGVGVDHAPVRLIVLQMMHSLSRRLRVTTDGFGLKPSLDAYLNRMPPPKMESYVGKLDKSASANTATKERTLKAPAATKPSPSENVKSTLAEAAPRVTAPEPVRKAAAPEPVKRPAAAPESVSKPIVTEQVIKPAAIEPVRKAVTSEQVHKPAAEPVRKPVPPEQVHKPTAEPVRRPATPEPTSKASSPEPVGNAVVTESVKKAETLSTEKPQIEIRPTPPVAIPQPAIDRSTRAVDKAQPQKTLASFNSKPEAVDAPFPVPNADLIPELDPDPPSFDTVEMAVPKFAQSRAEVAKPKPAAVPEGENAAKSKLNGVSRPVPPVDIELTPAPEAKKPAPEPKSEPAAAVDSGDFLETVKLKMPLPQPTKPKTNGSSSTAAEDFMETVKMKLSAAEPFPHLQPKSEPKTDPFTSTIPQ